MRPLRLGISAAILASIVFTAYFAVSLGAAQAGHVVDPALYQRSLTAQRFATASHNFGALRGLNLQSYIRRFSALSRLHRMDAAGVQSNGQVVTTTNWTISPAGMQINLGDFPVNAVLSPDGGHLLVVNSGAGVQSIQVVDTSTNASIQSIPYNEPASAFVGAAYSPAGNTVYVSGGGQNVIHTFSVGTDGTLTATGDIALPAVASNPLSTSQFPTGLSVSRDGQTLYVADSNTVANTMAIISLSTRTVTAIVPVGNTPYGTIVDPASGTVVVSNWGDGTLSLVNPSTMAVTGTIAVGKHPTAMAFGPNGLLYVTDANSDAVSVVNLQTKTEIRRLSVIGNVSAPFSSSPQGLAFSPDKSALYVANAGNNSLAVFAVSADGSGEYFQGWIPTAWYPTSVAVSGDGSKLFVANGWGMGEGPNSGATSPNPTRTSNTGIIGGVNGFADTYCHCTFDQFSGSMDIGTLSTIGVPGRADLRDDTLQVFYNDHFLDITPSQRSLNNPVPLTGGTSPIKHVIYIIKENRTYDQVFGDQSVGNGNSSLTLFPRAITPNLHALADRFGVVDNFYADAQVSADGHNWILSANANDYDEKFWPQDYSAAPGRNFGYPFESGTALPQSPGGFLWDDAAAANVSYRTYGEYTNFCCTGASSATIQSESQPCAGPSTHVYHGLTIPAGSIACFAATSINPQTAPNLVGHIDPHYPPYDTNYPDMERFNAWKKEFDQYVASGNLPALELMRLSQDHTKGTTPGQWTPQYMVADNDAAVGAVVDAVSHSPYWASTAIFVTEDDAQNGPDHVDSHRTEALVISPYTAKATPRAESVHYDTAGMVRTIELLLGLKPMSQYDATAMPMWQMFSATPDTTAYTATAPQVSAQNNTAQAYGARQSAQFNFRFPDQAPAYLMNRILWHAMKGAHTPYPNLPAFRYTKPVPASYFLGALATRSLNAAGVVGGTGVLSHFHR